MNKKGKIKEHWADWI